jgi:CBS domain-containing protein
MKISTLMTPDPVSCTPSTNLAAAAALMLEGDCGILPVLENGRISGVVTDRDLFIALGTRDLRPSAVTVGQVMTGPALTCGPDDDVDTVLGIMKDHAIRRVPVEGFGHTLIGIVSMNDLVLAAGASKPVHGAAVVDTLQAICAHHHPAPRIAVA